MPTNIWLVITGALVGITASLWQQIKNLLHQVSTFAISEYKISEDR